MCVEVITGAVAHDRNAGEIAACQRDELAYVRRQDTRKVGVLVVVLKEGTPIEVRTQILGVDAKCLHVYRTLHVAGTDPVLAANEQMLLNVDMSGPRAAPFAPSVWPRVQALAEQHRGMPRPKYAGRSIALPG